MKSHFKCLYHFTPWVMVFVGIEREESWVEVKLCDGRRLCGWFQFICH